MGHTVHSETVVSHTIANDEPDGALPSGNADLQDTAGLPTVPEPGGAVARKDEKKTKD